MNIIRFGSRDSKLALIQTQSVIDKISYPCQIIAMKTTGDFILDRTLDKIGGKGLFVKELDQALADGRVDFTVHSLKDMPMEQPKGFPIVAYSERADVRDVLVLAKGLHELDLNQPIGCASARRKVQLERLFPQANILPIRGNLQTRLQKLDSGAYGALVLAAAGLHRLGLQYRISRYFSIEEILPAAGQGIIAVQGKQGIDHSFLQSNSISCDCAMAERSFTATLDGGCSSPVAAYAHIKQETLHLRGMYVNESQTIVRIGEISGARNQAIELGRTLAHRLKQGE